MFNKIALSISDALISPCHKQLDHKSTPTWNKCVLEHLLLRSDPVPNGKCVERSQPRFF